MTGQVLKKKATHKMGKRAQFQNLLCLTTFFLSERLLGIVTCNIIALFLGHSLTITEGLIRKETRKDASKNDVSAIIHLKNDDLSVFFLSFLPFFRGREE